MRIDAWSQGICLFEIEVGGNGQKGWRWASTGAVCSIVGVWKAGHPTIWKECSLVRKSAGE